MAFREGFEPPTDGLEDRLTPILEVILHQKIR